MSMLARLEGVSSAIAAARAGLDAVSRDRGVRTYGERRRAQLAELAAGAERRLLGIGDDDPLGGQVLAGGLRVAVELPDLAAHVLRTPRQAVARIHTVWAHGLVPDDQLGQSVPPANGDDQPQQRLARLMALLATPTSAPGVVLAGVAHAELVQLNPFGRYSGAVARWVERAVLSATGADVTGLAPMQAVHADRQDYAAALAAYASGTTAQMSIWLRYCAQAMSDAAELMGAQAS